MSKKEKAIGIKLCLANPKEGKTENIILNPAQLTYFIGKKIGDEIDGSFLGRSGHVIKITGGTDRDGFPMRPDVSGGRKVSILLSGGIGYHPKRKPSSKKKKKRAKRTMKGKRKKVIIRGNVITDAIAQINAVLIEKSKEAKKE
jgi:small subunit ribosomal protein S6e